MSAITKAQQFCTQDAWPNDDTFSLAASISGNRDISDAIQYESLVFLHVYSTSSDKWVEGFGYLKSNLADVRIHFIQDTSVNTVLVEDLAMLDFGSESLIVFVTRSADQALNHTLGETGITEAYQSNMQSQNRHGGFRNDPRPTNIIQLPRKGRHLVLDDGTRYLPAKHTYLPAATQQDMHYVSARAIGASGDWVEGDGGASNPSEASDSSWGLHFAEHVAKNLVPLGRVCRIPCSIGGAGFISGTGQMAEPNGSVISELIDSLNRFWAANPYNYVLFMLNSGGEADMVIAGDTTTFAAQWDAYWAYLRGGADGRLKFNKIQPLELWQSVSGINCSITENATINTTYSNRPTTINRLLMKSPYKSGNHRLATVATAGITCEDTDNLHFSGEEGYIIGQRAIRAIDIANNNNNDGSAAYRPNQAPEFVSVKRTSDTAVDLTVWEAHAEPSVTSTGELVVELWNKTDSPNEEIWEAGTHGSPFTQFENTTTMHQVLGLTNVAANKVWGVRVAAQNSAGTSDYHVLQDINPLMIDLRDPGSSSIDIYPVDWSLSGIDGEVELWVDRSQNGFHAIVKEAERYSNLTYNLTTAVGIEQTRAGTSTNLRGMRLADPDTHDGRDITDLFAESFTHLFRFNVGNITTNSSGVVGTEWEGFQIRIVVNTGMLTAGGNGGGSVYNDVEWNISSDLGKWISIGVIYDEANTNLKLLYGDATTDFTVVNENTGYTAPAPVAGQPFKLGAVEFHAVGLWFEFDGEWADYCLWNAAMTPADLIAHMETWNPEKALPQNVNP